MSEKTVLFRADASPEIGGGHIVRCTALAEEFTTRGYECHLLTQEKSLELFSVMEECFSKIAFLNIRDHLNKRYDFLVLDLPEIDYDDQLKLGEVAKQTLLFSDNPSHKRYADFLIDSNFGRLDFDYEGLINQECKLLLGSHYVPIRNRLLSKCHTTRDHILVSVGFTDPANMVERYIAALKEEQNTLPVDLVIGYAPEVIAAIEEMRDQLTFELKLHIQPDNLNEIYQRAVFALGAGGGSVWERAALMVPSITVQVAENQRYLLERMQEIGALMHLGEAFKLRQDTLRNAIRYALKNSDELSRMAKKAHQYCDGHGTKRIVNAILGLKD